MGRPEDAGLVEGLTICRRWRRRLLQLLWSDMPVRCLPLVEIVDDFIRSDDFSENARGTLLDDLLSFSTNCRGSDTVLFSMNVYPNWLLVCHHVMEVLWAQEWALRLRSKSTLKVNGFWMAIRYFKIPGLKLSRFFRAWSISCKPPNYQWYTW